MTTPPWRRLPWDSTFFGLEVGRIDGPFDDDGAIAGIAAARRAGIRCLYLLASTSDLATIAAAQGAGFRLADVRVTFERVIAPARDAAPAAPARDASASDVAALQAMTAGLFTDSRFYADPNFARERCDALYATWVAASVAGELADRTLIVDDDVGFVTWKAEGDTGSIGLVGVAAGHRGRGLGRILVEHAIGLSAAAGHRRITVVTQGRNLASQRLYQRAGFVTSAVELWYHAWL